MGLQKSVNLEPAAAVAGDRASQNPMVYYFENFKAASGGVTVGMFAFQDTTDGTLVKNVGSSKPLGFVERTLEHFNYTTNSDGSLVIPAGGNVAVAIRGDFYVVAAAAVTKGHKAYVNNTTGAITFAATGSTVTGATETDWTAMNAAAAAGDLVVISNWG